MLLEGGGCPGAELSGAGEFGWGGVASTWFFVDPKHDLVRVPLLTLASFYISGLTQ
jgi:CubicO group peptidase (beta-lactamase class C family)